MNAHGLFLSLIMKQQIPDNKKKKILWTQNIIFLKKLMVVS